MHKLECNLQDSPGALERCLRVIRIRGYELLQLQAESKNTPLAGVFFCCCGAL